MVNAVDEAVAKGITKPREYFDKHRNRSRDLELQHPAKETLEKVKAELKERLLEI